MPWLTKIVQVLNSLDERLNANTGHTTCKYNQDKQNFHKQEAQNHSKIKKQRK